MTGITGTHMTKATIAAWGWAAAGGLALTLAASADVVSRAYPAPTLDRWMYPFGATPGLENVAPTFGAIEQPGFDDRDGEFLIGFDTTDLAVPGQGAAAYRVAQVRVRVFVAADMQFRYDPSFDSVRTLLQASDPLFVPDADPGKPLELFACGYRAPWSVQSFQETSPFFAAACVPPPAQGCRAVFPIAFDGTGTAVDVSNQVRQRFDAAPMAIGTTLDAAAGELVPAGSEFVFDVSLCEEAVRTYFREGLNAGRINLLVSSLSPAQGGPGGGTGDPTYPVLFTRENPGAVFSGWQAKLEIVAQVGDLADRNGDGVVDFGDYLDFLNAFDAGDLSADYTDDCVVDFSDYLEFLNLFNS